MPPLWDRAFRERFYTRWGRESAVISATTRRVEYPDYTQLLSIKMMTGGREDYFVDGRRVCVDDDTYLILNAGRRYASRIDAMHPAHSFSVFFPPGLAEEAQDSLARSTEALLAAPAGDGRHSIEFDERLREHDTTVTPVLRHIQQAVDVGVGDAGWIEEQLHFLLGRMLRLENRRRRARELIPSTKPATRRELYRRIGLGVTFIHTHYMEQSRLKYVAHSWHMSPLRSRGTCR